MWPHTSDVREHLLTDGRGWQGLTCMQEGQDSSNVGYFEDQHGWASCRAKYHIPVNIKSKMTTGFPSQNTYKQSSWWHNDYVRDQLLAKLTITGESIADHRRRETHCTSALCYSQHEPSKFQPGKVHQKVVITLQLSAAPVMSLSLPCCIPAPPHPLHNKRMGPFFLQYYFLHIWEQHYLFPPFFPFSPSTVFKSKKAQLFNIYFTKHFTSDRHYLSLPEPLQVSHTFPQSLHWREDILSSAEQSEGPHCKFLGSSGVCASQ